MHPSTTGSRIAIIGVGQVGAAAAYAMILASVADELLLVDSNVDRRDSQVQDLSDAAYASNTRTRVLQGSYREASQCDIVVITAGSRITMGETPLGYTYRNMSIIRSILSAMTPFKEDAIIVVVSNPVDILTTLAQGLSKLPPRQVIGSGTFLDSVRLRGMVADKTGLAAPSIDLQVLGVHGQTQVAAWSTATVVGIPLDTGLPPEVHLDRAELENDCSQRAADIIQAKGSNPFGIGSIVSSICSSILSDKRNIRPVSHFQPESGCCYSLPAVLGRKGVTGTIKTPLDEKEEEAMAKSVQTLRNQVGRWNE